MFDVEYQPAATIQPGNISYREPSLAGSEDDVKDDSSDLSMTAEEYDAKIREEIGLGEPTEAEKHANQPILVQVPNNPKEKKDLQARIHVKLHSHLQSLTKADRFRATNLYAPPGSHQTPQFGTAMISPFGPSTSPQSFGPIETGRSGALNHPISGAAWPVTGSKYYALPAEPPVASVPPALVVMDGAERVDRLVEGVINGMRDQAEAARAGPLGGPVT